MKDINKLEVKWSKSDLFKKKFIVVGKWNLNSIYSFPREKVLSADTETHHYFNSQKLQNAELSKLYKDNGAEWTREHVEVRGYAYMLSNGTDFVLFQCIEDFIKAVSLFGCKKVIWYNAKFDFTQFDYYFLKHKWKQENEEVKKLKTKRRYGKMPANTFDNTMDEMGHRYKMTIWIERTTKSYHNQVFKFEMVDLLNIIPGSSLRTQLEQWGIVDETGEEVRKLEMDYVNDTIEDSIQYMINDTKGLHLLAEKVDRALFDTTGYSFIKGDFMTAGGLAKKVMYDKMFRTKDKAQIKLLMRTFFPMTPEYDKLLRDNNLYKGGLCFINPMYVGKSMRNIYKYDVNSMYPAQMYDMLYPTEEGEKLNKLPPLKERSNKLYIICLKRLSGHMKPNRVPVWKDSLTGDFVEDFEERDTRMIWLEELEELEWWYDLEYTIEYVIQYKGRHCKGLKDYIDTFYTMKKTAKGSPRSCAKLLLNSAYGKWAQRIEAKNLMLEMTGNHVHIINNSSQSTYDISQMMSVVVGSKITSNARICLLHFIREICKDNPKKYFIYCDTDSVHALVPYDKCDDKELGKMKCEGVYSFGKYLAPKTYLMYEPTLKDKWDIHTKGVNTSVVRKVIERCKDFETASKVFAPQYKGHNITFKCLTALNVIGGKALILVDKMLLKPENYHELDEDERIEV